MEYAATWRALPLRIAITSRTMSPITERIAPTECVTALTGSRSDGRTLIEPLRTSHTRGSAPQTLRVPPGLSPTPAPATADRDARAGRDRTRGRLPIVFFLLVEAGYLSGDCAGFFVSH